MTSLDASPEARSINATAKVESEESSRIASQAGVFESPYVKELSKNIRNIKKKLNATQKVDAIIAENPGASLDELLASKKINPDQKVQAQKKPALQASLTQLEEQLAQCKQFDQEYQRRLEVEREALRSAHEQELKQAKLDAVADVLSNGKKEAQENLLILSKFLRAAAAKRQSGDEMSPVNRAFEGALLLVYGGDESAVTAMQNLIGGSDAKVPTIDSVPSDLSFKQVRDQAVEYIPQIVEDSWVDEAPIQQDSANIAGEAAEPLGSSMGTDPTLAHAGLTELDSQPQSMIAGVVGAGVQGRQVPNATNIDARAANKAGASSYSHGQAEYLGGDEWVQVPRAPDETDTGLAATPGAPHGTQSWTNDVLHQASEHSIPTFSQQQPLDPRAAIPPNADGFRKGQHPPNPHNTHPSGHTNGPSHHHNNNHQNRGPRARGGPQNRGGGYRGNGERRGRGGPGHANVNGEPLPSRSRGGGPGSGHNHHGDRGGNNDGQPRGRGRGGSHRGRGGRGGSAE